MKKIIVIIACLISGYCFSQESAGKGVQWALGLNLEQAKAKAKKENKYVFVDCYTTWCGPCKMMDAEVFSHDSVARYFNEQFVAVKVQMDRTATDNAEVKNLYATADAITKNFRIEGYPTYLIFSPDGLLTEKYVGASLVIQKFLAQMRAAVAPGKVFKDPYKEYGEFVDQFKAGKINYDRLPEMVTVAKNLNETETVRALVRAHSEYVSKLSPKQRYTESNIKFWKSLDLGPNSKLLQFFVKDEKKINRVMKNDMYSSIQVDKCIQNFVVPAFFATQRKPTGINMGGMQVMAADPNAYKMTTFNDEADWQKLYDTLRDKFSGKISQRNVLQAKMTWYGTLHNYKSLMAAAAERYAKFPNDFSIDGGTTGPALNAMCWGVFANENDQPVLKQAVDLMAILVQGGIKKSGSAAADYLDTYASLLYKIGKKEEAIAWQEKAVAKRPGTKSYSEVLSNMRNNWPTRPDVIWDGNPFISWTDYKFTVLVIVNSSDNKPLENVTIQNSRTGETSLTNAKGYTKLTARVGDSISIKQGGAVKNIEVSKFKVRIDVTL